MLLRTESLLFSFPEKDGNKNQNDNRACTEKNSLPDIWGAVGKFNCMCAGFKKHAAEHNVCLQ